MQVDLGFATAIHRRLVTRPVSVENLRLNRLESTTGCRVYRLNRSPQPRLAHLNLILDTIPVQKRPRIPQTVDFIRCYSSASLSVKRINRVFFRELPPCLRLACRSPGDMILAGHLDQLRWPRPRKIRGPKLSATGNDCRCPLTGRCQLWTVRVSPLFAVSQSGSRRDKKIQNCSSCSECARLAITRISPRPCQEGC